MAIDDKEAAERLIHYARSERPDLHIVARAKELEQELESTILSTRTGEALDDDRTQSEEGKEEGYPSATPASAKVAMPEWQATAAFTIPRAAAAPDPSPRRIFI